MQTQWHIVNARVNSTDSLTYSLNAECAHPLSCHISFCAASDLTFDIRSGDPRPVIRKSRLTLVGNIHNRAGAYNYNTQRRNLPHARITNIGVQERPNEDDVRECSSEDRTCTTARGPYTNI